MNALVGVRANSAGLLSPSQAARQQVWDRLDSQIKTARPEALKQAVAVKQENETGVPAEQELDRDAFLLLLVTQLQNQDPLDPVDNTDMIAQLAQFSSLEQMQNLNEGFENIRDDIGQFAFTSASSLMGQVVTGIDADGEPITGLVEAVTLENGEVRVTVAGESIRFDQVTGVIASDEG